MQIYQVGQTFTITVQFVDINDMPITLTGLPSVELYLDSTLTTLIPQQPMVYNNTDITYEYVRTVPAQTTFWTYTAVATYVDWLTTYTAQTSFIIGTFMYMSVLALLNTQVGIDRTQFSTDQLENSILVAQEILNNYLGFSFLPWGEVTEEGETMVDHTGNIFFSFRGKNLAEVTMLQVRVPWTQRITLEPARLDLVKKSWYGYYPISVVYAPDMIYPMVVINMSDKLRYYAEYTLGTMPPYNGWVPYLIQYVISIMVKNLMMSQAQYNSSGVTTTGSGAAVKKFISGKYSVEYHGQASSNNIWNYSNKNYNTPDTILTPDIRALLESIKGNRQNTFI